MSFLHWKTFGITVTKGDFELNSKTVERVWQWKVSLRTCVFNQIVDNLLIALMVLWRKNSLLSRIFCKPNGKKMLPANSPTSCKWNRNTLWKYNVVEPYGCPVPYLAIWQVMSSKLWHCKAIPLLQERHKSANWVTGWTILIYVSEKHQVFLRNEKNPPQAQWL